MTNDKPILIKAANQEFAPKFFVILTSLTKEKTRMEDSGSCSVLATAEEAIESDDDPGSGLRLGQLAIA
jgi:hypothetical protein